MWPRGLLCTLLAATAAATPTDGGTTFVERTPLDKIWCPIARAPGSLDVCGLVGKITPRFSSCACELAYVMATFLLAYYLYLEAEERGVDSSLQYEQLLQWISVFNQHYSREFALLEMTWPLLSGLRSLTSRRSAKGYGLSPRPAVDLVQAQKDVGRSFWAKYFCSDYYMSRYVFDVLAYSAPAQRWRTSLALQYNIHNGTAINIVIVPAAQIVQNYAHANNSGNQAHYQAVYQHAAQHFLQHNALPGNAPLHQFVGDDGVVGRAYDFDLDAIDDAAAEADDEDDEDASMPDAERAVVAIVASHVVDAPAAAADALDVAALPRLATTLSAFDAFSAPRLAFIAAAPSRAEGARDAADDGLDAGAFLDLGDCGEQPFAATASAGPALQALHARCPELALAPTSFIRRLASDPGALDRFTEAVASSTTLDAAAGRDLESSAFYAPTLFAGWDALGALDVYDATAGTVLDRPTALPFAGGARTTSLLIAAGADVSRSGTHNASGDDALLHLFAGALGPTSTEADPPDGAAAADGSTDAVDANGAAVPATTTTAASVLRPEQKTLYQKTLTTLKDIRNNIHKTGHHGGDGILRDRLNDLAKVLRTPCGKPMNRQAAYMTGTYWEKEPGKKKPKKLFLTDTPFLAALITELEAFLGLEPSTVDEASDDDDDDAEEAVPDASAAEARRLLANLSRDLKKSMDWLKARCAQFEVDCSELGDKRDIKEVLVSRLKEIVADADEALSVEARAKVVMHLIAKEAKGSGLDADEDEFRRVLWFVACAGRAIPLEIVLRNDFLSAALACLQKTLPSSESDAPPPAKVPRTAASYLDNELWEKIWTLLDGEAADTLRMVSRAGNAVVPQRLAVSMKGRRQAVVNEDTDPKSRRTMLRPEFLAVDVNAPKPEVLAKVDEIARLLLLDPGKSTVHEGMEGRASTPGEHMRNITDQVPFAAVELAQLCLKPDDRDKWFRKWTNDDVGCTIITHIKTHSVKKLLEHYVDGILRGETEHVLDKVVSTPSAYVEVTLRTSLETYRDASDTLRGCFMDTKKTIPSGNYGNARKHSTPAAIKIIRDATVAIEARLAVLTKDYPAKFDKAVKFFLGRFKPKDDAEAAEAAAWRSWLQNPNHVNAVARKAAGEVKKKRRK